MRKNPEKTSPRKIVPTGDRPRARCVTSAHATTCSTAVVDRIHLSDSSQTCSIGDKSEDPAGQSRIRTFSKAFLVRTAVWCLAVFCWNMPFDTRHEGYDNRVYIVAAYWRAFSRPSENTQSVLLSYPIASHTMIPGVGEVCASIIAASSDFHQVVYGHVGDDLTATNRSEAHHQTPENATQCPS